MQVCKYASMQVCKYASMLVCKHASMQVCTYIQVCKYASIHVCKYAIMQVWKYASMQICKNAHICKYVSMQVCSYMQRFSENSLPYSNLLYPTYPTNKSEAIYMSAVAAFFVYRPTASIRVLWSQVLKGSFHGSCLVEGGFLGPTKERNFRDQHKLSA